MLVKCGKYTIPIVFQDKFTIIIHKPWGLASQKGANVDISVPDILGQFLLYQKTHSSSSRDVVLPYESATKGAYVGLVHRLDRCVSGLMVIAKNSRAARQLTDAIKTQCAIEKTYLALVYGHMVSKEWKRYDNSMVNEKGKELPVSLSAKCLGHFSNHTSLVKIQLITGRKRQIRAQLSYLGHPILGDFRFGAPSTSTNGRKRVSADGIALSSYKIAFKKPLLGFTEGFEIKLGSESLMQWQHWLGSEDFTDLGLFVSDDQT